jgi:hypothetical protein
MVRRVQSPSPQHPEGEHGSEKEETRALLYTINSALKDYAIMVVAVSRSRFIRNDRVRGSVKRAGSPYGRLRRAGQLPSRAAERTGDMRPGRLRGSCRARLFLSGDLLCLSGPPGLSVGETGPTPAVALNHP